MMKNNILPTSSTYLILNKELIKIIGLEASVVLSELIDCDETKKHDKNGYFQTKVTLMEATTTLTISKIKNGINKLYKKGLIEVIVHNNDKINVKILYLNIFTILNVNNTHLNQIKKKRTNSLQTKKKFKKPKIQELKDYFFELSDVDESETMFDYYESNGWKVGKTSMKCWKSATRNWIRRAQKNTEFPDYYDSKLESQISNNPTQLTQYHNHLKKLGWKSIYSPSAGTTWKKPKT